MMFKRVFFGYSRAEVDAYLEQTHEILSEKDRLIENLHQEIRKLEYTKDELHVRLSIYQELHKSYGRSAKVEESSNRDISTMSNEGACSHE